MADAATIRAAADAALADFGKGVKQIRDRGNAARAAMESATGTASSADGAVVATVGADGALTDISFGPAASSRSRESLAAAVVETTRTAHIAALSEAAQRVGAIEGDDSAPVAVLRHDRDALGTPPPDAPAGDEFPGRGL